MSTRRPSSTPAAPTQATSPRSQPTARAAVAFGILLDTIIVCSVLVTALNLDIGRWMWWPSKLAHRPDPNQLNSATNAPPP